MGHRRETKTASTSHTPITAGFLLMLWTLNFVPTTEAIDSTCNLSQYGSSGNLVCEFSEDIGKHSFGVLWYPRGIKNKTGHEIILDCTWLQHGLDCTRSSENFQFDNKVSNSITLKISELDGNNDGRYECVLIPTNGGEYSPCYYSYK
ncbi:hypothetical protein BaRGS_00038534, partial [Batillaria attramentaria]